MHTTPSRAALIALLAAGTACGPGSRQSLSTGFSSSTSPPPAAVPRPRLEIAIGGDHRYANTSIPVSAVMRAGDSSVAVPFWSLLWDTRPLGRMWVTSDGMAQLIAPGRVDVRARTASHRSSTTFRVERNPVAEVVAVAEVIGDVHPGDTVRVAAIARDEEGRKVADARLRYLIASRGADELPARIDSRGRFVSDSAGLFMVLVESNGSAARVPVLVKPRPIVAARMRSEDAALAAGVARLETVNVTAAPTSKIRVSSPDYEPYIGTTVRLDARVWTDGSDEPDTTATPVWETSNPDIALVDHRGTVMFVKPGFVTISATHGAKTARRRMQVWPSPAVRVVLRSNARYPRAGDAVKLIDYAWQRGGLPVHHARSNFAIMTRDGAHAIHASISEAKEFTARVPGTYTVLSELNGLTSTVTFTVHAAGGQCELRLRKWDPSCDR